MFYIVLLGAAALVYALLLPGRKSATEIKQAGTGDLEATLEQFMSEIERENEELIGLVAQMKQELTSKQLAHQEQIVELRQRMVDVEYTARQNASRLEPLEQASVTISSQTAAVEDGPQPEVTATAPLTVVEDIQPESDSRELTEDIPAEPEVADSVRDRYPELFELHAKGKSMDTIAKTIGIQRGEVQLILQLAKREESL
ncbi:hypothetical protein DFP94_10226 [Fontibacillus phaseoli]|uniref:Uncharacterized protein n=1 Tax=Fontibacillus phaseoli TaxID=1416533 RepID=A0A369BI80_9BACL|nr:hypothetical protein DFP94_10226 [Fontibacillus phaseoli]